jgi:hypothetical protein
MIELVQANKQAKLLVAYPQLLLLPWQRPSPHHVRCLQMQLVCGQV